MPAHIGNPAPDFTLRDPQKIDFSLADLRGRKSLIVFIPFPFTGGCQTEMCAIRDHMSSLQQLDANVIAITCDTVHANRAWSEQQGFGFPVLSDFWPHGATCRNYGCFNEDTGSANRVTYVLDADGVVREIIATDSLGTLREFDAYLEALEKI